MSAVTKRNATLGDALRERRRQLERDLRHRIRTGRAESAGDVGDSVDRSDANSQRDIEVALLQLRTETLARIDAALVRLDAGKYGFCFECEDANHRSSMTRAPSRGVLNSTACAGRTRDAGAVTEPTTVLNVRATCATAPSSWNAGASRDLGLPHLQRVRLSPLPPANHALDRRRDRDAAALRCARLKTGCMATECGESTHIRMLLCRRPPLRPRLRHPRSRSSAGA